MSSPTPILLSEFTAAVFPFDCVRKDDPAGPQSPAQLDEQRLEYIADRQTDSKQLLTASIIPWRIVATIGGPTQADFGYGGPGHSSLEAVVGNFSYWDYCPWGARSEFFDNRDFGGTGFELVFGNYSLDRGGTVGDGGRSPYLAAFSMWNQDGDGFSPPMYIRTSYMFQVTNPIAWGITKNYQIWQVTGRWGYRPTSGGQPYPDDGYPFSLPTPSPPWAASSDFTLVGSGKLAPGQVVTVAPPDLDPIVAGTCQAPPAPAGGSGGFGYGAGNICDWDGFAVARYLVFV